MPIRLDRPARLSPPAVQPDGDRPDGEARRAAPPATPYDQPADGALGAHTYAVTDAYKDFKNVAIKIAKNAGLKALS